MKITTRFAILATAVVLGAGIAQGQALATYGSAELAGFGEGSALIGGTLSTGRQGLSPIASAIAQTYRYRSGASSHDQAFAVSPSLGLQYQTAGGAVSASAGYTFVSDEITSVFSPGAQFGLKNSPFVSAQVNHWGTGEHTIQWIGNYGTGSEYYWTRLRGTQRLAPSETPIYVGAEGSVQGSRRSTSVTVGNAIVTTQRSHRFQVGPVIEYRMTPSFRVGLGAGYRGGPGGTPGTGYARIEFLTLSHF